MKKKTSFSTREMKRKTGINPKEIYSMVHGILNEIDPTMAEKIKREAKIEKNISATDVLKKLKNSVHELEKELMEKKPKEFIRKEPKVTYKTYTEKMKNTR